MSAATVHLSVFEHGAAVLARLPLTAATMGVQRDCPARVAAARVARQAGPPILVVSAYAHANDVTAGASFMDHVLEECYATGEDFIAAGDWNRHPASAPFSNIRAGGLVRWMDEPWQFELRPTTQKGDLYDFGASAATLLAVARGQAPGPADHELVFWDVEGTCLREGSGAHGVLASTSSSRRRG